MTKFKLVASREDIAEVARLACEIWPEHYVPIIGQAQVDYMLEKFQSARAIADQLARQYEYYLVLDGGQSAGYVAIVPSAGESTLLLSKMYIRKELRGQGMGKETLGFVEGLCRQRGIKTIWLTVNKNNARSLAWYKQMGFDTVRPAVQDIGGGFVMDDFVMEKQIETFQ